MAAAARDYEFEIEAPRGTLKRRLSITGIEVPT
jgi:hypothetical protein